MTFTIAFVILISALIFIKMKDVSLRNNLKPTAEKRLVTAGALLILFFITNATLPYPESLYWFIFLGILCVGCTLCLDILKKEFNRFKKLETKNKAINVLFYSLFTIIIHLYM